MTALQSAIRAAIQPAIRGVMAGVGGTTIWSPTALFAANEAGVWYDPSDLSTMFQASTGGTRITADGQSVGLILDKSKGLAITGLTTTLPAMTCSATVTQTGNVLTFAASPSGDQASGNAGINGEKVYSISFTVAGTGSIVVYVGATPSSFSSGTHTVPAWHAASASNFIFRAHTGGFDGTVTFHSLHSIAGNHAYQTTAAARPKYTTAASLHYLLDDLVDDSIAATVPSMGTDATVAYAEDGATTILTAQTIGAGTLTLPNTAKIYGYVAVNRALTGSETTSLTAYLNAKRGA